MSTILLMILLVVLFLGVFLIVYLLPEMVDTWQAFLYTQAQRRNWKKKP